MNDSFLAVLSLDSHCDGAPRVPDLGNHLVSIDLILQVGKGADEGQIPRRWPSGASLFR